MSGCWFVLVASGTSAVLWAGHLHMVSPKGTRLGFLTA